MGGYFYPRPPRGGRHSSRKSASASTDFYPRPPRGGRRLPQLPLMALLRFLSTPSARRATTNTHHARDTLEISIHALREEGDLCPILRSLRPKNFYPRPPRGGRQNTVSSMTGQYDISIHALREEGDAQEPVSAEQDVQFLSTPSARRATVSSDFSTLKTRDFYPRPPRGGRPCC